MHIEYSLKQSISFFYKTNKEKKFKEVTAGISKINKKNIG
ncbi:hypothetical protein BN863_9360 [Formosa agariphila KMM 3901]|uniref:Uncharacterized protein n=1 Tax=Formosa agariphila (strain DSM 15362 / KCTC 12365 / LMG 23005 / KMM 3901 / M-2Alg 35-1) TaxID=1347342 RepID=T2KJP2_FORAG|nr:hypothetical protein BN863_9360 [Formosa agariphila KMM 3901]